jgi:glycosyltransferase involved in cell wall biosynthesis
MINASIFKSALLYTEDELCYSSNNASPTSGTLTAFSELAKALAAAGIKTFVFSDCNKEYQSEFLVWKHFNNLDIKEAELIIVNVRPKLFKKLQHITSIHKILWLHNEAKYLFKLPQIKLMLKYWPILLFSGKYHKSTFPWYFPTNKKLVIGYGIMESLVQEPLPQTIPAPRAIFTSNPLRSLRWLVDIWQTKIHPVLPNAELIIYSGSQTYGKWGDIVKDRMDIELNYARSFASSNVFVKDPIPKNQLFEQLKNARLMVYKGDQSETFCLAIAEAQALGIPCVVGDLGSMKERVQDGITGYVTNDEVAFANHILELFQNDPLWTEMSKASKQSYTNLNWDNFVEKLHFLLRK